PILFPAIFLNSVPFHSVQGQMAIGYARQVRFPVPALAGGPYFWRNLSLLGACLALFAFFAALGHDLPLTIIDPLIDLR
ncbi:MAG TPA: hypothetical protein VGL18_16535, partial [Actinomycetota bacterium]